MSSKEQPEGLPVETFRDAAKHLRRPFTPEAVKFKPQSQTKSGQTLCVAYIDARLVFERLNLVVADRWSDAYEAVGGGLMWCYLTVDGITRSDVGEGKGKALVSDAVKRAAVHFGVGVSLYAIPTMFLPGRVDVLYSDSKEYGELRKRYRAWLDSQGRQAFGEPLDHGDVEDAQGEPEVDATPVPAPEPIGPERASGLLHAADGAGIERDVFLRAVAHVAGEDLGESINSGDTLEDALMALDGEQAYKLARWIDKKTKNEPATEPVAA